MAAIVLEIVLLSWPRQVTLPALQKVLAERDQDVRPLMREEDAKVLMGGVSNSV